MFSPAVAVKNCRRTVISPFLSAKCRTIDPGTSRQIRRPLATTCQHLLVKETKEVDELDALSVRDEQEVRKIKSELRHLLRDMAQPVAVVTSFMPGTNTSSGRSENADIYHGATLSSFTSIAMDPHPLVAFALRIPSRMASALTALSELSPKIRAPPQAHMVVNLLSSSQASAAVRFSRPDLYPTPFRASSSSGTDNIPYTLNLEGLPIMDNAVGALSCQLVGRPIPLYDLDFLQGSMGGDEAVAKMPPLHKGEVASELFIARVIRVENVKHSDQELEERERTLPLVYHRQNYTSCAPKQ